MFRISFYFANVEAKRRVAYFALHVFEFNNDSCMKSSDSISHILRFKDEKEFLQIKHNLPTHRLSHTETCITIQRERNANLLNTTIIDFALFLMYTMCK